MRIDELHLAAFGRFHGQRLTLQPGLTILYGPNEAGKTTVGRFLLGMLYGFKRAGQRRDFTADSERYRPWAGGDYRGSLRYTLADDRTYLVERQFDPRRDEVRIFDALTGDDLTGSFPMDRRKEVLFAETHWKLSEDAFRATAWVGQLAVSQVEQARELVTRVANLQESGREDVSVKAALAILEKQAADIGTERAGAKPYGRLVRSLADRRAELDRATQAREQVRGWEARLAEVHATLAALDADAAGLAHRLSWARLARAEERLARVEALTGTGTAPESNHQAMAESGPAAARALAMEDDLAAIERERLSTLEAEADRLAEALEQLEQSLEPLKLLADGGSSLLDRLDALDAEDARLRIALTGTGADSLRFRADDADRAHRQAAGRQWVWAAMCGALLAAGGVLAFLDWLAPAAGAAAVGAICLWLFLSAFRRTSRLQAAAAEARAHMRTALDEAARTREAMLEVERARSRTLAEVGAASVADLRAQVLRCEQLAARRDAHQARLDQLETERQRLRRERLARQERLAALISHAVGHPASPAEFQAAYARWLENRDRAGALKALLGEDSLESLQAAAAAAREQVSGAPPAESPAPLEILEAQLRTVEARRAEQQALASDLAARIETATQDLPDTADLRREIAALDEARAALDDELAALELAQSTIAAVAGEMHRDFAPKLNEAIGSAVSAFTGGRYDSVRLAEDLHMRTVTADSRIVDLTSLSGGTVDQFYLGLRLALLDLFTEGQEPVPLILDDPFVQYDDDRAREAMAFLTEVARSRQVILMTCHTREPSFAPDAHLINLADAAAEGN